MQYAVVHTDNPSRNLIQIVSRLWDDNLPVGGRDLDAKFRWYYRDNPCGRGDLFLLSCQDSLGRKEFVGCGGVGPRTFYWKGKPLRAALPVDFAVDKAHRTVSPALMLQRRVQQYNKEHFDFAYAFPGNAAVGVFLRVGYRELGRIRRFVRILDYEPYLRNAAYPPGGREGGEPSAQYYDADG